jgi:hypothetical protein
MHVGHAVIANSIPVTVGQAVSFIFEYKVRRDCREFKVIRVNFKRVR